MLFYMVGLSAELRKGIRCSTLRAYRERTNMTGNIEYIKMTNSESGQFSEYVLRAKGENRSLTEFAKQCGVNVSTLSRIVNKKNQGPSSDALVASIARNADPDSGITLDMLMNAQGKYKADQKIVVERSYKYKTKYEEIMREALRDLGYKVEDIEVRSKVQMCDFAFRTNAIKEEGINKWVFETISDINELDRALMRLYGQLYISSTFEQGMKISVLINNKKAYDALIEKIKDEAVYDLLSVILINFKTKKVIDEYLVKQKGKRKRKSIFISYTY